MAIELIPPRGGLRRVGGYSSKPPFWTEDCLNVLAYDVFEDRAIIGSRPGLVRAFPQQLGSGNPVLLGVTIRTLTESQQQYYSDGFAVDPMTGDWSHVAWNLLGETSDGIPAIGNLPDGYAQSLPIAGDLRSALLTDKMLSTGAWRKIEASWKCYGGEANRRLYLILDLDGASPDPNTGGVVLRADFLGGANLEFSLYVNGTRVVGPVAGSAALDPNSVALSIDEAKIARCHLNGSQVFEHALASYTAAGTRVGFGLRTAAAGTTVSEIGSFALYYTLATATTPRESVLFGSNSTLWREAPSGTLVSDFTMSAAGPPASTRVFGVQRLQEIFVADYGVLVSGTAGVVSGAGTTFDDAAHADWTVFGIDTTRDVLEIITAGTSVPGVYRLTTVAAGTITLASSATNGTGIKYRILRMAKIVDVVASPPNCNLVPEGTPGVSQFPVGCRSVRLWDDRLVWCNNDNEPHGWWMSAKFYPKLYDYGDSGTTNSAGVIAAPLVGPLGAAAAATYTQSEFAGMLGEPLVTTIPANDDLLVFACRTGFFYLRGNPRLTGSAMNNISRDIGISGIDAWCSAPDGRIFVLSPDGLYVIYGGGQGGMQPESRKQLPAELLGLRDDIYEISLAYDVRLRVVLIIAAAKNPTTDSVYFAYGDRGALGDDEYAVGSFWPLKFTAEHAPMVLASYQPGGIGIPVVLWGCRDGYIRRLDPTSQNDDGENFDSYIDYGPIGLGRDVHGAGYLTEWSVVLSENSGVVVGEARVGHSAQKAKKKAPRYQTSFYAGRDYIKRPQLYGHVAYLRLRGSPCCQWSVDSHSIDRGASGKIRVTDQ